MKNFITLGTLSLITSAFLVGCGSDSATDTDIETGYFIDAPVKGLTYKSTSGLTGVTDAAGTFKYKKGEKVHFSLGKLDFGEATPTAKGLVSPRELAQDEASMILMLRTLQALDSDNDPSNGITIPASIITALQNIASDVSISDLSQDSNILDISVDLAGELDEDTDGVIDVNDTEAQAHFEESMTAWHGGATPDGGTNQGSHGDGEGFDLSTYPTSTLTQEVIDSLAYMGNEERLAYDIYTVLHNYHANNGVEIKQMANIPKSEKKHVQIVQDIIQKYNINTDTLTEVVDPVADKDVAFADMPMGEYDVAHIQELYDDLYAKGIVSKQAALEVGCIVEVVDVDDLDKFILQAEEANATDIVAGFNVLRNGSYNHYWAFDKGLKNMGVSEGCGVLGSEYAKTEAEFPSSRGGGSQGGGGNN